MTNEAKRARRRRRTRESPGAMVGHPFSGGLRHCLDARHRGLRGAGNWTGGASSCKSSTTQLPRTPTLESATYTLPTPNYTKSVEIWVHRNKGT